MNKGVWCFVGLVAGFAAGYFVGKHVMKKKLEQVEEELKEQPEETTPEADIPEALQKRVDDVEKGLNDKLREMVTPYRAPDDKTYVDYNILEDDSVKDAAETASGPRIIDPAKDNEDVTYPTVKRTYYADGVVADEDGRELSDDEVDETIGLDNLDEMGEYEDDFLLVRNDELQMDFAIYGVNEVYQYTGGHHDPDIGLEDDE